MNLKCFSAITALFLFSMTQAMQRVDHNSYIELDTATIKNETGQDIRFYGEYRARELNNSMVEFPLSACDPLPLNNFGDIRYFFPSAIGGAVWAVVDPIKISDPAINTLVVVRGKNDAARQRFEAYIGYDKNRFTNKGRKRVYLARLLALRTKSLAHVEYTGVKLFNGARTLIFSGYIDNDRDNINNEINKHVWDREDRDWNKPAFLETFHNLLGKDWIMSRGYMNAPQTTVFTKDEAIAGNGTLYSNKVYWTENENKLKGTTYQSK